MPIYEYQCQDCGHQVEIMQRLSDPPPARCESCGSSLMKKLISAPAFQFKGSGWYVTDYARKNEGGKDGGKDAAKADSGAGGEKGGASQGGDAKASSTKADGGGKDTKSAKAS